MFVRKRKKLISQCDNALAVIAKVEKDATIAEASRQSIGWLGTSNCLRLPEQLQRRLLIPKNLHSPREVYQCHARKITADFAGLPPEIGRESCRERVCQYV